MCSAQTCDGGKQNKNCNLNITTAQPSDIRVAPGCNRSDVVSNVFGDFEFGNEGSVTSYRESGVGGGNLN